MSKDHSIFGNLKAYRNQVYPTAIELAGSRSFRKSLLPKHKQNVQEMLELLAINGKMTTWDLAKISHVLNVHSIRARDKIFRRLLVGRIDRGNIRPGVLDVGLVIKDGFNENNSHLYRLSLHGLLYCFSIFDFTHKEIEKVVNAYSDYLPMIFNNWYVINKYFENSINVLQSIGTHYTFENDYTTKLSSLPFDEINRYIHTKYVNSYESILESDFANQISFWFFTNLPISHIMSRNNIDVSISNWKYLFDEVPELKLWYFSFLTEIKNHSLKRIENLENHLCLQNFSGVTTSCSNY